MAKLSLEIKNSVVKSLEKTQRDIEFLNNCAGAMKDENTKSMQKLTSIALPYIQQYIYDLENEGFCDSKENYETALKLQNSLAELREQVLDFGGNEITLSMILSDLSDSVRELKESAPSNKVMNKVDIPKVENDEMDSAKFVFNWLAQTSSYINTLKENMESNQVDFETVDLIEVDKDPMCLKLDEQIATYKAKIPTARTQQEAIMYLTALKKFEASRNERVSAITKDNQKKMDEFTAQLEQSKSVFEDFLVLFNDVYKLFTGKQNMLDYQTRMEILRECNLENLTKDFKQLIKDASRNNFVGVTNIKAKLEQIKNSYNVQKNAQELMKKTKGYDLEEQRKKEEEQKRIDEIKIQRGIKAPVVEEKEPEVSAEMLAELAALGFGAPTTTTVTEEPTKTPEVGTVEQVNVKEEKDPWAELLKEKR